MARVVLDASVVIGFLDASDAHHSAATTALEARASSELVLPASAYAEVLVGPYRRGSAAVEAVERFVADFAVRIEPIEGVIARQAAALRARHPGLALGDALVLASGERLGATTVLTADRGWLKVSKRAQLI